MKILIVGGGMSGLCYGILCARKGRDVLICEKNARVGKKISVTGNGRCNLGNQNVSERFYNDGAVVKRVLNAVSVAEYLEFLRQCGIITFTDGAGRIYPLCESAPAIFSLTDKKGKGEGQLEMRVKGAFSLKKLATTTGIAARFATVTACGCITCAPLTAMRYICP